MPCKDGSDAEAAQDASIREYQRTGNYDHLTKGNYGDCTPLYARIKAAEDRRDALAAELCALRGNCIRYFDGLFGGGNDPEWMRPIRIEQARHRAIDKQNTIARARAALQHLVEDHRRLVTRWGSAPEVLERLQSARRHLAVLEASDPMNTELY